MADNDLGYRFTNEMYATKKEVQNILKVTLIDKHWTHIVEYRSHFTTKTGVKSIDDTYFSICLAPSITDKINAIERKINKIYKKYHAANSGALKNEIGLSAISDCVKTLANNLMIEASDNEIRNIVNNNVSAISPEKIILQKYAILLKDLYTRESVSSLDAIYDYLYEVVTNLIGISNENSGLYRTKSLFQKKIAYTNTYDESPVRLIEPLMSDLFNFISSSNRSFVIKMAVAMFYINYVKPFDAYNELVASLISKYILLNNDLDPIASFINFESIFDKSVPVNVACDESQKACDLTYFIVHFCNKLSQKLDQLANDMLSIKVEEIKNEYYGFDKPNTDNIAVLTEEELKNTIIPEQTKEKEITDIFAETDDEEEIVEVAPVVEEKEITTLQNLSEREEPEESTPIKLIRNAAITNLTYGYNEEEARKVEQYILDSNPNLSRPQAYFFARHCTIGKFYTIAQYKKEIGCAYETARNAMDKLVSQGYYAKEPYKNKFIYTPIKKK